MRIRTRWRLGAVGAVVVAVLAGTVGGAAAGEPEPLGTVRGADRGPVVAGEYIVVMDERRTTGAAQVRDRARQLTRAHGGAVERTYTSALRGFAVRATERQARRLAADPAVAFVEPNRLERGDGTQTDPGWHLDRVDQRRLPLDDAYTYDTTATGVTAYVVDSGIRVGHREFGGRARYGYNFVDGTTTASDCHGHGTHVAAGLGGATHGVAKGVRLVAVKVLNCDNLGTTANVLAGYDWVARNAQRPAVANVSIGGSASDAKDAAVRAMVGAGVTVAVSAGNSNAPACGQSPAREPSVLTVAATSRDDARAAYSNHGSCVDLFAPGDAVVSAGHTSDTATATRSGTSMAAPQVAGAAALVLARQPLASPGRVAATLTSRATTGAVTGRSGAPDRLLYTRPTG
ncbi:MULTISPECIES: S8 family peptidase [Streptomyces]|uniref:S8 family peptidase n=1 Tax=Streptomyces TaxID=1883 RepID=UPI0022491AD4|nr:S8 family peptidase [Streptomyces sp. JHD 1]MCX2968266.1 S8 family peptidase [Streptomyces sp. JHD 1]